MTSHVLIIEDNLDNMELMSYLLKAHGYEVFAAHDGNEAQASATLGAPQIILCDILLPDTDGYQLAAWFKNHPLLRNVPLVAITALAMAGDEKRALKAGFDGYISKPIIPEAFVSQVEAFLLAAQRAPTRTVPTAVASPARYAPVCSLPASS